MALISTGSISIGGTVTNRSINVELGRAATANSSLGETDLRTLAGVSSGAIGMGTFRGKSNSFVVTVVAGGSSTKAATFKGYDTAQGIGSASPSTTSGSNFGGTSTITQLVHRDSAGDTVIAHLPSATDYTWWSSLTISRSGYTSLTFTRANSIDVDGPQYSWTQAYNTIFDSGGTTVWTFS